MPEVVLCAFVLKPDAIVEVADGEGILRQASKPALHIHFALLLHVASFSHIGGGVCENVG